MKVPSETLRDWKQLVVAMDNRRFAWLTAWRDIADYYIPRRYTWLQTDQERVNRQARNPNIVDGTGTTAGRILAAGMLNGITSPTRPWFRLRFADFSDDADSPSRQWLDEIERRMLIILAESNFYNAMAVMFLDLAFFNTASCLIYEDDQYIINCINNALGEFYFGLDASLRVTKFARQFKYTVSQIVELFGLENCSQTIQAAYAMKGAQLMQRFSVTHVIEPNTDDNLVLPAFKYREVYYESNGANDANEVLSVKGFYEKPGIWPRWEVTADDEYGMGPGFDALGDVIQLQHETKRKAQSLDYMLKPPLIVDAELQHKPTALVPGGQTFVRNVANTVGAKPAYTVQPPIQEITMDLRDVQARIKEIFHNDLFKMISQLETVRSATEIDARREEKLVLLGPVLDRFKNEALDPAIIRTYAIMQRKGLIPPPPPTAAKRKIEINYVSILASAQSAAGVAPTERFMQVIGNLVAVYPQARNIPNWDDLLRDYGKDLGVKAKHINTPDQTAALNQQDAQAQQQAQQGQQMGTAADAAKVLSQTQVGGGANALQTMLGS